MDEESILLSGDISEEIMDEKKSVEIFFGNG